MFGLNKTFAKFKSLGNIKAELEAARAQADSDLQNLLERNNEAAKRNDYMIVAYQSMNAHLAAENDEARQLKTLVEGRGEAEEN